MACTHNRLTVVCDAALVKAQQAIERVSFLAKVLNFLVLAVREVAQCGLALPLWQS